MYLMQCCIKLVADGECWVSLTVADSTELGESVAYGDTSPQGTTRVSSVFFRRRYFLGTGLCIANSGQEFTIYTVHDGIPLFQNKNSHFLWLFCYEHSIYWYVCGTVHGEAVVRGLNKILKT